MNENKLIKILAYLAMLIIAIGGPVLAYHQFNKEEIKDVDSYEKDDDYEDEYEDEEDNEEEYDDESNYEDEYEDEDFDYTEELSYLDPLLEKTPYKVTYQDKLDLIDSTNCDICMSESLVGEMFKDDISDTFKLLYTANKLVRHLEDNNIGGIYGLITIDQDTLLEYANKIFSSTSIPKKFDEDIYYLGTKNLTCSSGTCTFIQETFGVTGVSQFNGYETNTIVEGNKIKTNIVYIEDEFIEYREEDYKYIFDIKIYDKKNGKLIKEIKTYEEKDDYVDAYKEFEINTKDLTTYSYTFDEENRLVSVNKE